MPRMGAIDASTPTHYIEPQKVELHKCPLSIPNPVHHCRDANSWKADSRHREINVKNLGKKKKPLDLKYNENQIQKHKITNAKKKDR